ncbi:hypothetical protein ACOMHN_038079 [Nucella lapillus]
MDCCRCVDSDTSAQSRLYYTSAQSATPLTPLTPLPSHASTGIVRTSQDDASFGRWTDNPGYNEEQTAVMSPVSCHTSAGADGYNDT